MVNFVNNIDLTGQSILCFIARQSFGKAYKSVSPVKAAMLVTSRWKGARSAHAQVSLTICPRATNCRIRREPNSCMLDE